MNTPLSMGIPEAAKRETPRNRCLPGVRAIGCQVGSVMAEIRRGRDWSGFQYSESGVQRVNGGYSCYS